MKSRSTAQVGVFFGKIDGRLTKKIFFRTMPELLNLSRENTMGQIKDNMAKMKCSECGRITYYTQRNKKKVKEKLELKKHCKFCKKHTTHTEGK